MLGRILIDTRKHIFRSSWVGWASVFVMTLAFLVASIFGGLALIANLYVNYIESKSNMLVFFNVGVDPEIVNRLKTKWEKIDSISEIEYLSEEDAFNFYSAYTSRVVPEQYQVLTRFEEKKLPSSLEIKISSLNDLKDVQDILAQDISSEIKKLIILDLKEVKAGSEEIIDDRINEDTLKNSSQGITYKYSDEINEPPINLIVDNENLEMLKGIFFNLRMAGLGALSLLFLFVGIFTFMTVEFRLYNQKDEIEVMQLVGGSLFFIRAPYILEGAFYGAMGALLSSGIIGSGLITVFIVNKDSSLTRYLYENFGQLPWPQLNYLEWFLIVGALGVVGFMLGSVSSYFSIRRYIR